MSSLQHKYLHKERLMISNVVRCCVVGAGVCIVCACSSNSNILPLEIPPLEIPPRVRTKHLQVGCRTSNICVCQDTWSHEISGDLSPRQSGPCPFSCCPSSYTQACWGFRPVVEFSFGDLDLDLTTVLFLATTRRD
ncbi:hypothetical protein ElyMa_005110100 [Elysia marginata]|uniref:Secreted protein n=1 Tax=Elysia marginata TaxID=1093978 RepID=A0AAV4JJA9_9GAST|nr:hypothetical protein ElyMa_005110100 [Elysia marginata]